MMKKQKPRIQRNPFSLYDPDGVIALAVDTLAVALERKTGVPVGRATATLQALHLMTESIKAECNLTDDQIAELVADWRSRHNIKG